MAKYGSEVVYIEGKYIPTGPHETHEDLSNDV